MAILHEILAVEGDLRKTAELVVDEAKGTFSKRPTHFIQTQIETKYFDASDADKLDATEYKAMVTTVGAQLAHVSSILTRYLDVYLQKEATNQTATADVVIDGVVFLENVPVVVLLGMEERLKNLRNMYEDIPTLQPGPTWERDQTERKGVYRSKHPEVRSITKKTKRPIVLYEATKEHPAQVQTLDEDIAVARRTTTTWSGMLSVQDKSLLIDRVDALIQAFKQARQRANETKLIERNMGAKIFAFLHAPIEA